MRERGAFPSQQSLDPAPNGNVPEVGQPLDSAETIMGMELAVHNVESVSVNRYDYFERTEAHPDGFTRMAIEAVTADGTRVTLTLFGSGSEGIRFTAPALEQRACHKCGNHMPREYHPRVKICSACETDGPPSEGPGIDEPDGGWLASQQAAEAREINRRNARG